MPGSLLRRLWRGKAAAPAFDDQAIEAAIARRDVASLVPLLEAARMPGDPRLPRWLAFAAVLQARDDEALDLLRSGGRADDAACLAEFGAVARAAGRPAAAARWWLRARDAAPQSRGLAFNIADAWLDAGDCAAAAAEAQAARREMPGDARPRLLAARIAERAGDHAAAAEGYLAVTAEQPECREAWEGLGRIRRDAGDFADAEAAFSRAGPDCLLDVGLARFHQRRHADAVRALDALLAQQPGRADARLVRANALIAAGDFAAGWPAYEARRDVPGPTWAPRGARAWDGASLDGTLLVDCEQGYGDCIFAARFLGLARARVGRLILRGPAPLVALFAASDVADAVIGPDEGCADAAAHAYLLSLPALLGLAAPRRESGYLRVPDALVRGWRERLAGPRPLVGLVWSGAMQAVQNRWRRFDPRPLVDRLAPHARLVSLQLPAPGIEPCPDGVLDLAPRLPDFAATGAALQALDALISAETATAHLGGALGVRTLVPLPITADWRWEIAGVRNPWYASVQVLPQARSGGWAPVWEACAAVLAGERGAARRADQDPDDPSGRRVM